MKPADTHGRQPEVERFVWSIRAQHFVLFTSCILLIISIPGFIAGIGLLKFRQWARILAIILAVLNILSFPLGTALAIYTFWVLLNAQTAPLFESTAQRPV